MRITFELEAQDIAAFERALDRVSKAVRSADEHDLVEAAKYAMEHLPLSRVSRYVRERLLQVQRLILMLDDRAWSLPMPERGQVLRVLAYVADPDDLIPDHVEVIGLLDDAIMLELLLRELKHVLAAWSDFCAARSKVGQASDTAQRFRHAAHLAKRRKALIERMRRRAELINTCTHVSTPPAGKARRDASRLNSA